MSNRKLINLKEKIFVAGASGMVGGALFKLLKREGYGNKDYGGTILFPSRKELNLLNSESVKNWFQKNRPTVVVLAAAKVGGIHANSSFPADFINQNLIIQTNVINSSWEIGVKRFVFLGSSCIYPKFSTQPIKEDALLTGPLESTNEWYAISKISGIKLCEALRKQYNFDAISLMPTNLYGPGDNYHPTNSHVMASLISKFCNAKISLKKDVTCWGTGKALREFMHVDDLAKAILYALENWDPNSPNAPRDKNNQPYTFLNVGTGNEISIKGLSELIAKEVGFKGNILWDLNKPDGTPRKILNIDKFSKMGWKSSISLMEGIKRTIKDYKENYL